MGKGPWGEAIKYWLPRKNMRQADLARAAQIEEKTISRLARGFHTTTQMLEKVAEAFQVPLEEVLVSPSRQLKNEERKREIADAVERALRRIEDRHGPAGPAVVSPMLSRALQQAEHQLKHDEAEDEQRRDKRKPSATDASPRKRSKNKRRKK